MEERYNNTVLHNYNIIESLRQLLLNLQLHLVTFCSQSESSDSSTVSLICNIFIIYILHILYTPCYLASNFKGTLAIFDKL